MRKITFLINESTKKKIGFDEFGVYSIIYKLMENGHFHYDRVMVDSDHSDTGINGDWVVTMYNGLDADFGYDCGPSIRYNNLSKAAAKSIERHLNKLSPDFVSYYAESERSYYEGNCPSQFI